MHDHRDFYFKEAKKKNYLARSIFKLEEIDRKYHVLKKAKAVLDLGCYPGSWLQYVVKCLGDDAKIWGVDLKLPQTNKFSAALETKRLRLLQADVFDLSSCEEFGLDDHIKVRFDVILSDMAPSTTGVKLVDQSRSLEMVQKVFELSEILLQKNGNTVVKIFEGPDTHALLKDEKKKFKNTYILRPNSTRKSSKEFFFIGLGRIQ